MQLIATRTDNWQLYRAGEHYFESSIKLDEEQLSSNGEETLMHSGAIKQLIFNHEPVKGWFISGVAGDALERTINTLEPMIIEFWKENKLDSWNLDNY